MTQNPSITEYALLALLALLWGASYLFIKIAVTEIPPLTLMAIRVTLACGVLCAALALSKQRLPRDTRTWRWLSVQAFFNSIGAWTLLAWGQQHVDAGLAGVLNSTSPLFVFAISAVVSRSTAFDIRRAAGALLGFVGVIILLGQDVTAGLDDPLLGQLACLAGAALYACAALYGRRFNSVGALPTATGTMLCAAVVLIPAAYWVDGVPATLPSSPAIVSTVVLSVACTGLALLLYFRLVWTLGPLGVTSQAYLRAGVGVLLGVVVLGETPSLMVWVGLVISIAGVVVINWPKRTR